MAYASKIDSTTSLITPVHAIFHMRCPQSFCVIPPVINGHNLYLLRRKIIRRSCLSALKRSSCQQKSDSPWTRWLRIPFSYLFYNHHGIKILMLSSFTTICCRIVLVTIFWPITQIHLSFSTMRHFQRIRKGAQIVLSEILSKTWLNSIVRPLWNLANKDLRWKWKQWRRD